MRRSFPEVFEVGFTARMENELDKVEDGDLAWRQVLEDFWGPFADQLAAVNVEAIIHEVHDLSKLADERCPQCGSTLGVRSGRFGPYVACERYPEQCDYSRSLRNKVPDRPTDLLCPKCGAPLVIKTGRYGEFLACTQYPKCKHTQPVPLGIKCPVCGTGDIAERRTRRGRHFWGCLRYPDCDYSTWSQPVAVACPACGFVGMEQKQSKTAGVTRKCMKCGHEVQLEEQVPAESAAG
jgi:DNA topoisomerase-1